MALEDHARIVFEHADQFARADAIADQPARQPGEAEAGGRRVGDRLEVVEAQPGFRRDLQRRQPFSREPPRELAAGMPGCIVNGVMSEDLFDRQSEAYRRSVLPPEGVTGVRSTPSVT